MVVHMAWSCDYFWEQWVFNVPIVFFGMQQINVSIPRPKKSNLASVGPGFPWGVSNSILVNAPPTLSPTAEQIFISLQTNTLRTIEYDLRITETTRTQLIKFIKRKVSFEYSGDVGTLRHMKTVTGAASEGWLLRKNWKKVYPSLSSLFISALWKM